MTWLTWLPKILRASTNKQLELIHELNKIFAYTISTQKWVVVLYTSNEKLEIKSYKTS